MSFSIQTPDCNHASLKNTVTTYRVQAYPRYHGSTSATMNKPKQSEQPEKPKPGPMVEKWLQVRESTQNPAHWGRPKSVVKPVEEEEAS
jgi:hypothetical protein